MAASGPRVAPEYDIGAPVRGRDGVAGRVSRVVLDPDTRRVVDLVVSVPEVGPDREVVLPADRVTHTDAHGVSVAMDVADVRALPPFEEVRFRKPEEPWPGLPEDTPDVVLFWAPRHAVGALMPPSIVPEPNVEGVRNIPEGSVAVAADLDVVCDGEVVGHVDRVLVDPEGDYATHLVVRRGLLERDEWVVPVAQVRSVTDAAVELACSAEMLAEMPRYRST